MLRKLFMAFVLPKLIQYISQRFGGRGGRRSG